LAFNDEVYEQRREKLKRIEALGQLAYRSKYEFTLTIPQILAEYSLKTAEALENQRVAVRVAGRIMAIRLMGKAGFCHLQQDGERLQIYVKKDAVGDQGFELYKLLDLGDHIGVSGYLFRTRTNELTIHVEEITFLSKDLLPLPVGKTMQADDSAPGGQKKWNELADVEQRYRQRYVDLVVNPEVREVFLKRSKLVQSLRATMEAHGFVEVETPMMQPIAGGAVARPFVTHHNTLDMDLYLRIAPELYLKRLVVGGFDRVYEINRNFRNEGLGWRWNPEFTMLEFYQAYTDFQGVMDLTQELITQAAKDVTGGTKTQWTVREREEEFLNELQMAGSGLARSELAARERAEGSENEIIHEVDWARWHRMTMREAITKFWPKEAGDPPTYLEFSSNEAFTRRLGNAANSLRRAWEQAPDPFSGVEARKVRRRLRILRFAFQENLVKLQKGGSTGRAIADVFEAVAEEHLTQPTIIYEFPTAVSPLSKQKPDEPEWTERWEIYAGKMEIANGFSELNDPEDQRRRFEGQLAERERGDEEAHQMDEDYIRALSYGMPPTGGVGVGVDRLCMLLTDSHTIRDVILFPVLRPEKTSTTEDGENSGGKP
jgi:lysyl-tRNA synthetase, class II